MQSIEIIVFFVFAILSGFLIISFIVGFDFTAPQEFLFTMLSGKKLQDTNFEKISYSVFLKRAADCWSSCSFGKEDKECGILYVSNDEEKSYGRKITLDSLKADFTKFNICELCKVEIIKGKFTIPSVIRLGCSAEKKALVIEG